jgi:hypothetical protein
MARALGTSHNPRRRSETPSTRAGGGAFGYFRIPARPSSRRLFTAGASSPPGSAPRARLLRDAIRKLRARSFALSIPMRKVSIESCLRAIATLDHLSGMLDLRASHS